MNTFKYQHGRPSLFGFLATLTASLALAPIVAANAQDTQDEQTANILIEEIVVTGVASAGQSKFDVSFSVTTLSSEEIEKFSPKTTADLLKFSPGVWVESSSGQSGANIDVRGFPGGSDAPFLSMQIEGGAIYPPPTLSFFENSTVIRLDETIGRVEVVRGGTGPLFSIGQEGITTNLVLKNPTEEAEGLVKIGITDFGEERIDIVYTGPLSESWGVMAGGFIRKSDGIRETEFPADDGHQFTIKLVNELEDGELSFFVRKTEDKNLWVTSIPFIQGSGDSFSDFPGFEGGTSTPHSNAIRLTRLPFGPNDFIEADLADGRGVDQTVFGASLDLDLGNGWSLINKLTWFDGDVNTKGLITSPPFTVASARAELLAGTRFTAAEIAAGGLPTGAVFTVTGAPPDSMGNPVPLADNVALWPVQWWTVDKELSSVTNDLRIVKEIFDGNTVTAGLYYANYDATDFWILGNNFLGTATQNSRLVDVTLQGSTLDFTRDGGFFTSSGFLIDNVYQAENYAIFIHDEWQVNDMVRIDAGVRWETWDVSGTFGLIDSIDNIDGDGVDGGFDGDILTTYDNGATVFTGEIQTLNDREGRTATDIVVGYDGGDAFTWTLGGNFDISESLGVFGRITIAERLPDNFDKLRDGLYQDEEVDQYEIGVKFGTENASIFATAFYNEFEGLSDVQTVVDPVTGVTTQIVTTFGSEAKGIEFDGQWYPIDSISLNLIATYTDAEFTGGPNPGNDVLRQPELQFRFSPEYTVDIGGSNLTIYATFSWVDDRFSDASNFQPLPSYEKVDLGAILNLGERVAFQLHVDNLTDEVGLTERGAQQVGAPIPGPFLARSIFGRSTRLSVSYYF